MTTQPEEPPGPAEPSETTEPAELAVRPPRWGSLLGRIVTPGVALCVFVLLCALLAERFTLERIGFGPLSIHFGAGGDATAPTITITGGTGAQTSQTVAYQAGAPPALAANYQGVEQGTNGFTDALALCDVSEQGSLISGELVVGDPEGDGDGRFVGVIGPIQSFSLDVAEPYQELSADLYQGSVSGDGEIAGMFKYDDGTGVTGTWTVTPVGGDAPLGCKGA
ncbi:MAG TPA: hypothetical protein VGM10_13290 [Actinocrinis sp.]